MEDTTFYNGEGEYGRYIMQELILPDTHSAPEAVERYSKYGRRVHWIDGNNMPGCFQMNTSWYFAPNHEAVRSGTGDSAKPHVHDFDEIIGFYGSNPDEPQELNGEIEFYLNGEKHILTKSSLIYIPAGMYHAPLYINAVEKPIFHFSAVMSAEYSAR